MDEYDPLDDGNEEAEAAWKLQNKQRKQANWEEAVVKRILTIADKPEAIRELRRLVEERTGKARLFFGEFYRMFPTFPVWLHCDKIPYVFETDVEELFQKPCGSKMLVKYCTLLEYTPAEWNKSVGLVFEWLHSGGQYKILHNYPVLTTQTQITFPGPPDIGLLVIENFDGFLKEIKWRP